MISPLLIGCVEYGYVSISFGYCTFQIIRSGNQVVLTSADGESAVYLLQSINSSAPHVKTVDITSEARTCSMTSTHLFRADGGSHEIKFNFDELSFIGVSSNDNLFGLSVEATLPRRVSGEAGEQISHTPTANLLNPSMQFLYFLNSSTEADSDTIVPSFFPSRTLENGQTYTDVIEFPGILNSPDVNYAPYSFNEVLISRNDGLIQISRNDGKVFTVVPE